MRYGETCDFARFRWLMLAGMPDDGSTAARRSASFRDRKEEQPG